MDKGLGRDEHIANHKTSVKGWSYEKPNSLSFCQAPAWAIPDALSALPG
jgi:hypothetical protein